LLNYNFENWLAKTALAVRGENFFFNFFAFGLQKEQVQMLKLTF
jgi:hypothetical protein